MLVYALYNFILNISASVSQTWLLQEVKTGYLYINIINFLYSLFVLLTSPIWSRVMQKKGTYRSLAVACFVLAATYGAYAFVNTGNFLWLMTTVRLVQHGVGMLQTFSVNNMLYISLPKKDQTNYTSCYTFAGNAAVFLGMSTGTAIVAAVGDWHLDLLDHCISAPAMTLLVQGVLTALLGVFVLLIRKKVETKDYRN
jgi:MFS family permease